MGQGGFYWCKNTGAGGGGNSIYWGQPSYQHGPGIINSGTSTSCSLAKANTPCREVQRAAIADLIQRDHAFHAKRPPPPGRAPPGGPPPGKLSNRAYQPPAAAVQLAGPAHRGLRSRGPDRRPV